MTGGTAGKYIGFPSEFMQHSVSGQLPKFGVKSSPFRLSALTKSSRGQEQRQRKKLPRKNFSVASFASLRRSALYTDLICWLLEHTGWDDHNLAKRAMTLPQTWVIEPSRILHELGWKCDTLSNIVPIVFEFFCSATFRPPHQILPQIAIEFRSKEIKNRFFGISSSKFALSCDYSKVQKSASVLNFLQPNF